MSASRKEKRMESKKRKLLATLTLIDEDNDVICRSKKHKQNDECVSDVRKQNTNEELRDSVLTSVDSNEIVDKEQSLNLTAEELKVLRAEIKKKQKASMQSAKLFLNHDNMTITVKEDIAVYEPSLLFRHLRHLLLYAIQGPLASEIPRWCSLLRSSKLSGVLFLVIEGVTRDDYVQHKSDFPFISEYFSMSVEMTNPKQYDQTVARELFEVPLSQKKLYIAKRQNSKNGENQGPISRLDLLLNEEDMEEEGFPLLTRMTDKTKNFVGTKDKDDYKMPTHSSKMFGLDCEMVLCVTESGEKRNELAWVAITDESGKCLLDEKVKPRNKILNYNTWVSGITKSTLQNVTMRIEAIQDRIRKLLPPDAILVGQSLNGDMNALEMFHPYVIDTSVIYNLRGMASRKPGLKLLTETFLHRSIQCSSSGHNPLEDAEAALQLVQLKLKKGLAFGNALKGWVESSSNTSNTDSSVSNGNDDKITTSIPAYLDFFELARQQNKSVAVGGFGDALPHSLCVVNLDADTDKRLVHQCREALDTNFMVCARFNTCSRNASQSLYSEASRRKVDKRVMKAMESIKPGILCVVVMIDSKSTDTVVCHLKITE